MEKPTMKTGFVPVSILILLLSLSFYACQKETNGKMANANGPHPATIFLTDHQTPVFDSVFIDIQALEVKVEDDSISNGGWITLSIRTGVYNILRFRNGIDTLFASGTLPSGRLQKIRLTLGTRNSAMKNGQSFPLRVKDEDRQVTAELNSSNFEIDNNGHVRFWIDFDASRSIQEDNSGSGSGNGFRLRSSIKIFTRGNSGEVEGKVLPIQADALVMAIKGTDTTMAIPDDDDGEFKILGLNAGTYRIFYDAQNGYVDTTINNIVVRNGEDTHLPQVTLHR